MAMGIRFVIQLLFFTLSVLLARFLHDTRNSNKCSQILSIVGIAWLRVFPFTEYLINILLLAADVRVFLILIILVELLKLVVICYRLDNDPALAVDDDYLPEGIGHVGFSMGLIDAELCDLCDLLLLLFKDVVVNVDHLANLQVVDSNFLLLNNEHTEEVPVDARKDRLVEFLIFVFLVHFVCSPTLTVVWDMILNDLATVYAKLVV
jgi:hypothetical protein